MYLILVKILPLAPLRSITPFYYIRPIPIFYNYNPYQYLCAFNSAYIRAISNILKCLNTFFNKDLSRLLRGVGQGAILLELESLNIALEFVQLVDLVINFVIERNKEWNKAFVGISDIINSSFILPISLLFIVLLVGLLKGLFTQFLLSFYILLYLQFSLFLIKLYIYFNFNFFIIKSLNKLLIVDVLRQCFLIIHVAGPFIII